MKVLHPIFCPIKNKQKTHQTSHFNNDTPLVNVGYIIQIWNTEGKDSENKTKVKAIYLLLCADCSSIKIDDNIICCKSLIQWVIRVIHSSVTEYQKFPFIEPANCGLSQALHAICHSSLSLCLQKGFNSFSSLQLNTQIATQFLLTKFPNFPGCLHVRQKGCYFKPFLLMPSLLKFCLTSPWQIIYNAVMFWNDIAIVTEGWYEANRYSWLSCLCVWCVCICLCAEGIQQAVIVLAWGTLSIGHFHFYSQSQAGVHISEFSSTSCDNTFLWHCINIIKTKDFLSSYIKYNPLG